MALILVLGAVSCAAPAIEKSESTIASTTHQSTTEPAEETVSESVQETSPDPEMVIKFKDAILEKDIRELLNKPEGDITVGDALEVTYIDFAKQYEDDDATKIHDITGLD